jgi:hypothetical protein
MSVTIAMCAVVAVVDPSSAADEPTTQPASADPMPKPAGEITAVRIGSRVVYRYEDADGHIVLVDQPPLGYGASKFENMAPPVPDVVGPAAQPSAAPAARANAETTPWDRMLRYLPWLAAIGLLAVGLAWSLPRLLEIVRQTLARRRTLTSVLDRSGYETMHGVILPLPDGRAAFFEHIVRTPSGLLVVGAEHDVAGKSRTASAREHGRNLAPDARAIGKEVATLDARVEAVKALAPGVPVFGRFVCTGNVPADGAVPRIVHLPSFVRALPEFRSHQSANAAALSAAWQSLRARAGRDETETSNESADAAKP